MRDCGFRGWTEICTLKKILRSVDPPPEHPGASLCVYIFQRYTSIDTDVCINVMHSTFGQMTRDLI